MASVVEEGSPALAWARPRRKKPPEGGSLPRHLERLRPRRDPYGRFGRNCSGNHQLANGPLTSRVPGRIQEPGPEQAKQVEPEVGLEPTTCGLRNPLGVIAPYAPLRIMRRPAGTDLGKCGALIPRHLFTTTRANTLRIACRRALGNCTEMTFSDHFWAIGTQNRRSEYAH